jgi:hypothetical protein
MNSRQALAIIIIFSVGALAAIGSYLEEHQWVIFSLIPAVMVLNIVALTSKCPNCDQPINGTGDFYKSAILGCCSSCAAAKS